MKRSDLANLLTLRIRSLSRLHCWTTSAGASSNRWKIGAPTPPFATVFHIWKMSAIIFSTVLVIDSVSVTPIALVCSLPIIAIGCISWKSHPPEIQALHDSLGSLLARLLCRFFGFIILGCSLRLPRPALFYSVSLCLTHHDCNQDSRVVLMHWTIRSSSCVAVEKFGISSV